MAKKKKKTSKIKKKSTRRKTPPVKSEEVPATKGLVEAVEAAMKSQLSGIKNTLASHDKRFDSIDKKFESLDKKLDAKFDEPTKSKGLIKFKISDGKISSANFLYLSGNRYYPFHCKSAKYSSFHTSVKKTKNVIIIYENNEFSISNVGF